MEILFTPPVAILIYLPLVIGLFLLGKHMAGPEKPSELKSSVYGGGEEAPVNLASPGYKPFFLIAFFFAILHLGILVLGGSGLNTTSAIYTGGLIITLIALILG